jgi:hypothetical protein
MEFSHDEVRRGLADVKAAQAEALPRWREGLARVFDPSGRHSTEAKRQVLGLPDRRAFLRVGGVTIAMSAVIAACGKKKADPIPFTGTAPTSAESNGIEQIGQELDVTLLRTSQSVEVLAVQTYQKALDSGIVTTQSLIDTIKLFQQQHDEHAGLIAATTRDAGGEPYDQPNSYLESSVVNKAVSELTDEASVLTLAVELENVAAQTYVYEAEVLSTPALRQAVMSIGGIEGRHLTVLYTAQQQPPVPLPFMPRRLRVDEKGYEKQESPPLTPTTPPPGSENTTNETAVSGGATPGTATQ